MFGPRQNDRKIVEKERVIQPDISITPKQDESQISVSTLSPEKQTQVVQAVASALNT
jgi:hypothetical protein